MNQILLASFATGGLLLAAASHAAPAAAYQEVEIKDGGAIVGQVVWEGEVPREASTEVPVGIAQQAPCKCRKVSLDRLKVDEKSRGVADCVIYIEKIDAGKAMSPAGNDMTTGKQAVLDQIGCRYVPEVMVVPPGTQILITSSDNTSHNVNARMGAEQRFNLLITRKGAKEHGPRTSVGNKPGVISLACNAGHPWMSGYIHVAAHPYYAVTDNEGRFELKDVPPGEYKLICWHASWMPRLLRDPGGAVTEVQYARPIELTHEAVVKSAEPTRVHFKMNKAATKPK
jgi:hypothetical protein